MNHVSYLRVSVLFVFLTKVLETFELIFSGNFCTFMYFDKRINKKMINGCICMTIIQKEDFEPMSVFSGKRWS